MVHFDDDMDFFFFRLINGGFWFLFDWLVVLGEKVFCLSLMVFGGRIEDPCDLCFPGFFKSCLCLSGRFCAFFH